MGDLVKLSKATMKQHGLVGRQDGVLVADEDIPKGGKIAWMPYMMLPLPRKPAQRGCQGRQGTGRMTSGKSSWGSS